MKKYFFLFASILLIQGCGDSHPTTGLYTGSNESSPQNIHQYSSIYAIDKSQLNAWKSEIEPLTNEKTLKALSTKDLLALYHKILNAEAIDSKIPKHSKYRNVPTDLDEITDKYKVEIQQRIESTAEKVAKNKEQRNALMALKAEAEVAKKHLDKIKKELETEKLNLEQEADTYDTKIKVLIASLDESKLQYSPKKHYEQKSPYQYKKVKADLLNTKSCQQIIASQSVYTARTFDTYVFTDAINLNGKSYCPYYIMNGKDYNQKKLTKEQFSDADLALIAKATHAKAFSEIKGKALYSDIRSVNKDNPKLHEQSRLFAYKEKRQLDKLDKEIDRLTDKKASYENQTEEMMHVAIRAELLDFINITSEHYILAQLQNRLTKSSKIQPDGTFNLNGSDNYIVEINPNNKNHPKHIRYAILRMEQFKNQDIAKVNENNFFDLQSLQSINL